MATTTVITDDLDGSSGAETVTFTWDGESYELDLSKKNRTAFEKALKPYIDAARRSSGRGGRGSRRAAGSTTSRRGRSRGSRNSASSLDLGAVRAWASQNGYQVSSRGRISREVVEAYQASQS
jgi:hypothetical protein